MSGITLGEISRARELAIDHRRLHFCEPATGLSLGASLEAGAVPA